MSGPSPPMAPHAGRPDKDEKPLHGKLPRLGGTETPTRFEAPTPGSGAGADGGVRGSDFIIPNPNRVASSKTIQKP